jgi:hypothetical protein
MIWGWISVGWAAGVTMGFIGGVLVTMHDLRNRR